MSNGLTPLINKKSVEAISSRVGQLKNELIVLEKIVKKILVGKKLTGDEKDTIDLLEAISSDSGRGWVRWHKFKKQLS